MPAESQVPGVHEVVGGELQRVLRPGAVAERQVHGEVHGAGSQRTVRRAMAAASSKAPTGSAPSVSPSNRSPTSSTVRPREQLRRPPLLVDEVVHQSAHVPARQDRRCVPAVTNAVSPGPRTRSCTGAEIRGHVHAASIGHRPYDGHRCTYRWLRNAPRSLLHTLGSKRTIEAERLPERPAAAPQRRGGDGKLLDGDGRAARHGEATAMISARTTPPRRRSMPQCCWVTQSRGPAPATPRSPSFATVIAWTGSRGCAPRSPRGCRSGSRGGWRRT